MRKWLIYARKSVVRNETDMESPERQIYVCNSLLQITETEPYTVDIYQDLDKSGSSEVGRDDWLRLKQDLHQPDVVGVVAYSLDRIYRNVAEFLSFLNELEQSNKTLKTARENLDTSGPLGRFVVTILMALYEMEWRLTSARMVDMIEHKRRHQGRHWGVAPFGTDRDENGQLVPSKLTFGDEQYYFDALAECFKYYAQGTFSYEQVAFALNTQNWKFRDRNGNPVDWDAEKVRSVVGRWRIYRGDLPLGNPVKNVKVEWLPGGHQPILPVELCDAVANILNERSRRMWNRSGENRRVYILTPLVYCHNCGMMLTGNTSFDRRLYRHRRAKGDCPEVWTDAATVEKQLDQAIIELSQYSGLYDDLIRASRQLEIPDKTDLPQKQKELQNSLSRLDDLYINEDAIAKEVYLTRRHRLLNDLAEIEMKQKQTGNDLIGVADQILSSLSFIQFANPKTKKALVSNLIERLEVAGGQIQTMTPKDWALPFFIACSNWAGWESNPNSTRIPEMIHWFNAGQTVSSHKV